VDVRDVEGGLEIGSECKIQSGLATKEGDETRNRRYETHPPRVALGAEDSVHAVTLRVVR
jgi:hypothetical protein